MKKELKNLKDTKKFAEDLAEKFKSGNYIDLDGKQRNVIFLQGELGAGKTTFSQYFLEAMGASGPFTSPTFVIMKKYELKSSKLRGSASQLTVPQSIYHLDCYRVDSASVLDLGWEELVADKNNLLLVEWPENIKDIWPEKYFLVQFKILTENKRQINMVVEKNNNRINKTLK